MIICKSLTMESYIFQVFIYLHRNASVFDSTNSELMPDDWPVKKYHFQSFVDVSNYWFNLNYICLNTPDGMQTFFEMY